MSYHSNVILGYGVFLGGSEAVKKFIQDAGITLEYEMEGGEPMEEIQGMIAISLNCFRDNHWVLIVPMELGDSLVEAKAKWDQVFPNHIDCATAIVEVQTS